MPPKELRVPGETGGSELPASSKQTCKDLGVSRMSRWTPAVLPSAAVRAVRNSPLVPQALFVALTRLAPVLAVFWIVLGLVASWALSYSAGGSKTAFPHLFYVPIILGAVRFSWVGGAVSALIAGLLAGPALPADVAADAAQPTESWLLRLAIFLSIGLFLAWVLRDRTESIGRTIHDTLLSSRLLRAIQRGELEVFYQPIISMTDREIVAVEALSRWRDARGNTISPTEFVPAAERVGAIASLDRFVMERAMAQVQDWSRRFSPIGASVNLSAKGFADADLCGQVERLLDRTGLPARQLQLELTESALIDDVSGAQAQIGRLRQLGVKVAIDDFGAGQASLGYLTTFAVDTVKIDRSLVERVAEEPRTARLVAGIIELFRAIDLATVAEGVETAEQYVHLQSAGCRLAQGYYVGRPVSADEMAAVLAANHSMLNR